MKIKYCKKCKCDTERLVSSNRCRPCNDANNDAYKLANPEKIKAIADAWRKANPEKYKASIAASRAKNPEYKAKARARSAAWRLANPNPRVNTYKIVQ
jgi:hypothetical protein